MTRFRKDSSWRQPGDGRVVIAGSPLRLFRVSAGGAHVLAAASSGEQPPTEPVAELLDRFVAAGALHPEYDSAPFTAADVTVITPVFGAPPEPGRGHRDVVVDDGSPTPVIAPEGTAVVRLAVNRGPAAARNTGLFEVRTPLVAFVDADVALPSGWLDPLLPHFTDPHVALVAPRVVSEAGLGVVADHESRHSPLDLGDEPARIAPGTRVSYVPAAAIVCRVDAVQAVGGFDETMRVGEDVDLVWRLVEAGYRCRYEPAAVVHHRPRPTLAAMVVQRAGYGASAASLADRHPGALAPVRMSGWSAAVWALVLARRPLLAAALAAGTAVALQRKLHDVPPDDSARLTLLGHLAAGRQLASAVTRVWWPAAAIAAVASPRARLPLLAALIAPATAEAVRRRSSQPLRDLPLVLLDEMSYGAGVWRGVVARRNAGPLLPSITSWPRRGDA